MRASRRSVRLRAPRLPAHVTGNVLADLDTRKLTGSLNVDAPSAANLLSAAPEALRLDGPLTATAVDRRHRRSAGGRDRRQRRQPDAGRTTDRLAEGPRAHRGRGHRHPVARAQAGPGRAARGRPLQLRHARLHGGRHGAEHRVARHAAADCARRHGDRSERAGRLANAASRTSRGAAGDQVRRRRDRSTTRAATARSTSPSPAASPAS